MVLSNCTGITRQLNNYQRLRPGELQNKMKTKKMKNQDYFFFNLLIKKKRRPDICITEKYIQIQTNVKSQRRVLEIVHMLVKKVH